MAPMNFDPYADTICAIGYLAATGGFLVSDDICYTKPVAHLPIFQPFTWIQPQLGNTMRIPNIVDSVTEEESQ